MTFALANSELGVSSLTINLVLVTTIVVLLGLPTIFLLNQVKLNQHFNNLKN